MYPHELIVKLGIAQGRFVDQYLAFQAAKAALQIVFDDCSADLDHILPSQLGPSRDAYIDLPTRIRICGDTASPHEVINALARIPLALSNL